MHNEDETFVGGEWRYIEDVRPRDITADMPQLPQSQSSLTAQLIQLGFVANRLGLYDAADFIQRRLDD
jgi:hypothetical protein